MTRSAAQVAGCSLKTSPFSNTLRGIKLAVNNLAMVILAAIVTGYDQLADTP